MHFYIFWSILDLPDEFRFIIKAERRFLSVEGNLRF